jgi:transposase
LREFAEEPGVCLQVIHKTFKKLGITRKKTFTYSGKSEERRGECLNNIGHIPEENRVYVDESGINSDLKREYGRAPRGVKVEDGKRGKKFHRVNVVAGQIHDEGGVRQLAPPCYQGAMNGIEFEERFENGLLKSVEKGKTIIMDGASFHREKQLKEICKRQEVFLLYLPPYSLDFNPIEKTWANMKRNCGIPPHYMN